MTSQGRGAQYRGVPHGAVILDGKATFYPKLQVVAFSLTEQGLLLIGGAYISVVKATP